MKSNIDSQKEKEAVQISLGQIKAKTEYQKKIENDIKAIKEKKGIAEIPAN